MKITMMEIMTKIKGRRIARELGHHIDVSGKSNSQARPLNPLGAFE